MKYVILTSMLFCVFVCAGCQEPSMNVQRSAARDVGDTSITIYLDRRDTHDVDEKKERIIAIVDEIEAFLNSGEIGVLTVDTMKKQVNKIVPSGYQDISNTVLSQISQHNAPTDKIPEKVIKNIKAILKGIRTGILEYKLEDRRDLNS